MKHRSLSMLFTADLDECVERKKRASDRSE